MKKLIALLFLAPILASAAVTNSFWNVNVTSNLITRTLWFSDGTSMTTAASGTGSGGVQTNDSYTVLTGYPAWITGVSINGINTNAFDLSYYLTYTIAVNGAQYDTSGYTTNGVTFLTFDLGTTNIASQAGVYPLMTVGTSSNWVGSATKAGVSTNAVTSTGSLTVSGTLTLSADGGTLSINVPQDGSKIATNGLTAAQVAAAGGALNTLQYFRHAEEFSPTGATNEPQGFLGGSFAPSYLEYSSTVNQTGSVWVLTQNLDITKNLTNEIAWTATSTGNVVHVIGFAPSQTSSNFTPIPTVWHSITSSVSAVSATNLTLVVFTPSAGETGDVSRLFLSRLGIDGGDTCASNSRCIWIRGWQ